MADFEIAVALTLAAEGGFYHNPKTGEVVNRGITLTLLRSLGILKSSGPATQSDIAFVASLSLEETKDIYHSVFWTPCKLDEIEIQPVANKVFDLQVNTGSGVRFLQRAINAIGPGVVEIDGVVGPKTIAAANACDPDKLLGKQTVPPELGYGIRCVAQQYYNSIPDPDGARPGWLKRLDI